MWPYDVPHRGAGAHGPGVHRRADRLHLQRDLRRRDSSRASRTRSRRAATSRWFRSRILGGRTNHYGRVTLRFADYDFKPKTTDGLGCDWPISYDDMAPYYDKAERFIGVTGTKEGIRSAPDGIFQPPGAPQVARDPDPESVREARHPRDLRRARR